MAPKILSKEKKANSETEINKNYIWKGGGWGWGASAAKRNTSAEISLFLVVVFEGRESSEVPDVFGQFVADNHEDRSSKERKNENHEICG